jgi:hypothetical protein
MKLKAEILEKLAKKGKKHEIMPLLSTSPAVAGGIGSSAGLASYLVSQITAGNNPEKYKKYKNQLAEIRRGQPTPIKSKSALFITKRKIKDISSFIGKSVKEEPPKEKLKALLAIAALGGLGVAGEVLSRIIYAKLVRKLPKKSHLRAVAGGELHETYEKAHKIRKEKGKLWKIEKIAVARSLRRKKPLTARDKKIKKLEKAYKYTAFGSIPLSAATLGAIYRPSVQDPEKVRKIYKWAQKNPEFKHNLIKLNHPLNKILMPGAALQLPFKSLQTVFLGATKNPHVYAHELGHIRGKHLILRAALTGTIGEEVMAHVKAYKILKELFGKEYARKQIKEAILPLSTYAVGLGAPAIITGMLIHEFMKKNKPKRKNK